MGILLSDLESKMVVLVLELMYCGLETHRRREMSHRGQNRA